MPRPRTPAEIAAAALSGTPQPIVTPASDTIPSYMIQPGQTPKQVEQRRRLAESLMAQGTSTAPVQGGWVEALARPLTAGLAGMQEYGAAQEEKRGQRSAADALAQALTGDKIAPQQLGQFFGNEWASPGQQSVLASVYENQQKLANQERWRPATPEEFGTYGHDPKRGTLMIDDATGDAKVIGGGGTKVDVNPGETAWAKERGQGFAKDAQSIQAGGLSGESSLNTLTLMEKQLQDPNMYTGFMGNEVNAVKKMGVALGLTPEQAAASGENFNALAQKAALDAMGGSLGTGFSNADRDFIVGQVANMGNTKEGNLQLIRIHRKIAQRKVEMAKMARQYEAEHGQLDGGFYEQFAQYAEANPLFGDEPAPAPPAEGGGDGSDPLGLLGGGG